MYVQKTEQSIKTINELGICSVCLLKKKKNISFIAEKYKFL